MFAALEFWDFWWIFVIVSLFAGGSAAYSRSKPFEIAVAARLRRIEGKLDLILKHSGLDYEDLGTGTLSKEVEGLADAARKIEAIKLHRDTNRARAKGSQG